nr:transposase [Leptospirillum ferriphilum]
MKLRSTNSQERLNEEIRRRARVIRIIPCQSRECGQGVSG